MKEEYFQMGKVTEAFLILMFYGIALAVIKVEWSKINVAAWREVRKGMVL